MADWKVRSQIMGDVVFFEYVTSRQESVASEVFVWDIDKTYLDTHFESVRGLWRVIREKAFQKRNIPGTASLVRALTSGIERPFPIYFITASPPQMEAKIHAKLRLDKIQPYGIFCKDNLKNLRPKRLRRLTQQVGYKLQALLQLRVKLNANVEQILWGDDSESDAVIYSLYSDVCSRRLSGGALSQTLQRFNVTGAQLRVISDLQDKIVEHDPVSRIYINLASDTDPEYYLKFGRRILPTYNTFQVALDLYQEKKIPIEKVAQVAQDMSHNYGFSSEELEMSFDDLIRRKVLAKNTLEMLIPFLKNQGLLPKFYEPSREPALEIHGIEQGRQNPQDLFLGEPWVPAHIDYLHDFR